MEELDIDAYIQSQREQQQYKQFSDDDTYALRALKKAIQNKLFMKYICELGIPDSLSHKFAIFYYLAGRYRSVTNVNIFMCREKMQPAKWYYKINEPLPKQIKFTPKHSVEDLMYIESLGHIKLKELQDLYTMPVLCEKYDLSLYQMKNIRYKRIHPYTKRECFKTLPGMTVVTKLRELINPDYWFIFPDELE